MTPGIGVSGGIHAMKSALAAAVCALLLCPPGAEAKPSWVLQLSTGTAWQARTRLQIEQQGEPDLEFNAHYETLPFTSGAPYYALRIGRWEGGAAWEFETHHHLVTLVDGPPEVQEFKITHGYNLNTVNRAWLAGGMVWRVGAGVVITHPESLVRGKRFAGEGFANGFYLSGACAQISLEKRLALWKGLFLSLEGKVTGAWARVPVESGWATAPNVALHALAGLGYAFGAGGDLSAPAAAPPAPGGAPPPPVPPGRPTAPPGSGGAPRGTTL
jgi:hypothetical protein